MKRILLILSATLLVTVTSAQQFKVGAIAGLAITDVQGFNGTEIPTFRKGGLILGGLVSTHISNTTKMQLEISYVQRGSQIPPDTTNNNNFYLFRLNYVDISLSVRQPIHLTMNHKVSDRYGLIFGLTYGTLISEYYESKTITYDISSETNNFEANAFVGFYYNFTPNFFFDFRYSNSFITAIKHNAAPTNGFYPYFNSWNDGNNMGFELRLGITFGGSATSDNAGPAAAPAVQ